MTKCIHHHLVPFTAAQRVLIDGLCTALTIRTGCSVVADYAQCDLNQHYVGLQIEELPAGSFGDCGPLVTLVTGVGATAGDGSIAVLNYDGGELSEGLQFDGAISLARTNALHAWLTKSDGAFDTTR